LLELLMVVGSIALLLSLLLPALSNARSLSKAVACASHLRQLGIATAAYTTDYKQRLAYIDSALWDPAYTTRQNWDADPSDTVQYPSSLIAVMTPYAPRLTQMTCPDAITGYPQNAPQVTYRIASADNIDAIPQARHELIKPDGTAEYEYPFKYFNGRPYRIETIEARVTSGFGGLPSIAWQIQPRCGEYYLARDFIDHKEGVVFLPHQNKANQLFIDLSVDIHRADGEGGHRFTDDRRGN